MSLHGAANRTVYGEDFGAALGSDRHSYRSAGGAVQGVVEHDGGDIERADARASGTGPPDSAGAVQGCDDAVQRPHEPQADSAARDDRRSDAKHLEGGDVGPGAIGAGTRQGAARGADDRGFGRVGEDRGESFGGGD